MSASPPTDRVIDVLELLASNPATPLSLSEISDRVDQKIATCHAVTGTLVERGWLQRHGATKAFSLGTGALALGAAAAACHPMALIAKPELELLSDELDMQASSSTCDGAMLTVIEAAGGPNVGEFVGARVPFAPPFGSVFVAWSGDDEQQRWLERADLDRDLTTAITNSLRAARDRGFVVEWHSADASRLRRIIASLSRDTASQNLQAQLTHLLADLSRTGYLDAASADEAELPVSLVLAPVRDAEGQVVLDIAAHPHQALSPDELASTGEAVRATAARIERALGAETGVGE